METNKKIDYGTLEWFDCENNFPPMRVDLYVDSEHGYGIGRLGRRVKDNSIIWTVHLESGEVYLVYAFYKVKRWAYMPKDEKTNTKLKYELKAVHAFDVYEAYTKTGDDDAAQVYLKSEADKVIADKDKEIAELKKKLMPCLNGDCILTCEVVEKYGKENAELKQKLENVQASMYADVVDANMEVRRLRRALWLARAEWARSSALSYHLIESHPDKDVSATYKRKANRWEKAKDKCLKKAEEYK